MLFCCSSLLKFIYFFALKITHRLLWATEKKFFQQLHNTNGSLNLSDTNGRLWVGKICEKFYFTFHFIALSEILSCACIERVETQISPKIYHSARTHSNGFFHMGKFLHTNERERENWKIFSREFSIERKMLIKWYNNKNKKIHIFLQTWEIFLFFMKKKYFN